MNRHLSRTLFWDGARGQASCHLAVMQLRMAPRLHGRPVEQIDYAPLVGLWLVLGTNAPGWRDLTVAEQFDLDARLQLMVSVGLAVWE